MDKTEELIQLVNCFNHISPRDIEEIMEWLEDNEYLSDSGICFRSDFWRLFIKKK